MTVARPDADRQLQALKLRRLAAGAAAPSSLKVWRRQHDPRRGNDLIYPREVSHTPTSVTASPRNMAGVSGSANSAQAHSMVTGGLR